MSKAKEKVVERNLSDSVAKSLGRKYAQAYGSAQDSGSYLLSVAQEQARAAKDGITDADAVAISEECGKARGWGDKRKPQNSGNYSRVKTVALVAHQMPRAVAEYKRKTKRDGITFDTYVALSRKVRSLGAPIPAVAALLDKSSLARKMDAATFVKSRGKQLLHKRGIKAQFKTEFAALCKKHGYSLED